MGGTLTYLMTGQESDTHWEDRMRTTHGADGRGGVIEAGGYRQRETG